MDVAPIEPCISVVFEDLRLQVFSHGHQTKIYLLVNIGPSVRPQPILAGAYEGNLVHG
jgi:hypothetical protein